MWDGSAWNAVGTGANSSVLEIAVSADNILYLGGGFTTIDGVSAAYIAQYNGTAFSSLGTGLNAACNSVVVALDGMLYVGGNFTSAGGITLTDRIAKWNGASWAHLDVDFPGVPDVQTVTVGNYDPVIANNYDIYVGFITTGAGYFSGLVTVANDGTANTYPRIIIERSGGTSAILYQIRNETTGKELLFDYSLLDGERLTIDLRPTQKSIVSNYFGSRPDAILANSDFGSFLLRPGDNDITCFVNVSGAPTVTAWMEWQIAYEGL